MAIADVLDEFERGRLGDESETFEELALELARQDRKWGEQNHDPLCWLAILVEEVGEVGKAACERKPEEYRRELIHVAAVAMQAAESFDRQQRKAAQR